MKIDDLRRLCLKFPGTREQVQWENDLLFKVADKMFLAAGLEPAGRFSIKCSEEDFHELTEEPGIEPAPYLARAKWVQIDSRECRLPRKRIDSLIRKSYDLVVAKLPKKKQRELAAGGSVERSRPKLKADL